LVVVVGNGVEEAQEARTLGAPLLVDDFVVALDGGCLLEQEYDWQFGSYFEECDDIPEGCVGKVQVAVVLLAVAACDGRAPAFCQSWA
jgi:hypothetical protein